MSTRPNILFIISDQHNAKVTGYEGHPQVKTPHLDRLAADGARFTNAVTQNPICTPSRTSFLSGQYCHNHGYYGLSGPHPGGLPSIFSHFRMYGYATAAIGKIHCPANWIEHATDVFHETCECSVSGRSPAYERFLKDRGKLHLEDHISITEFGDRGRQSMDSRPSDLSFDESQDGWVAAQAVAFMRQEVERGRPFIIQASLPRPHQCTTPSAPFWDLYEGLDLTLPPNADYDLEAARKAPHLIRQAHAWRSGGWPLFEPRDFPAARLRKLRGYLGAVSQVDHAVGHMLAYLDQAGIADDTIVIYTSDHGDYATEHGLMEKAPGICHDAITRIPYIWRVPGVTQPGRIIPEMAEAVDLSATICALAGLPPMETSDGRDLSPLLRGGSGDIRRIAVTEFAWSKSVRQGHWRLVHYPRDMFPAEYPHGFGELYDLATDPWEMTNLYFQPQHQDRIRAMTGELLDWLITTTRPKTTLGAALRDEDTDPELSKQRFWGYRTRANADDKLPPSAIARATLRNYI